MKSKGFLKNQQRGITSQISYLGRKDRVEKVINEGLINMAYSKSKSNVQMTQKGNKRDSLLITLKGV
jgi:hypothetical protein